MKKVNLKLPFDDTYFIISGNASDKSIVQHIELNNGFYEPGTMRFLKKHIKEEYICFDIGANIGVLSLTLAYLANKGKIYSFEAGQNSFYYLNENILFNKIANITTINRGVLDKQCEMAFSFVEEVSGCSFMSTTGVKEGIEEIVLCTSIDNWVKKNQIKKVDFIKVDIEGAEGRFLKGAINTIIDLNPSLLIEFNPTTLTRFYDDNPSDLFRNLRKLFDHIYILGEEELSAEKIDNYDDLRSRIDSGKGWENVYCTNTAV